MTITKPTRWQERYNHQTTQLTKINEIIDAINLNTIKDIGDWLGSVLDKDTLTPPAHVSGERYLINGTGAGGWVGKDFQIAESDGAAWTYTIPSEGSQVWVEDENAIYYQPADTPTTWLIWWNQAVATTSTMTLAGLILNGNLDLNTNSLIVDSGGDKTLTAAELAFIDGLDQLLSSGASPTFVGLILSGLTASQIVETNGSKQLISAAKATGYNKAMLDEDDMASDSAVSTATQQSIKHLISAMTGYGSAIQYGYVGQGHIGDVGGSEGSDGARFIPASTAAGNYMFTSLPIEWKKVVNAVTHYAHLVNVTLYWWQQAAADQVDGFVIYRNSVTGASDIALNDITDRGGAGYNSYTYTPSATYDDLTSTHVGWSVIFYHKALTTVSDFRVIGLSFAYYYV